MPRDLFEVGRDFPDRPDWTWLQWFWVPPMLLHFDARLQNVPADGLAYLATPLSGSGGAALAADQAMEWLPQLGRAGVYAISPAMLALALAEAERPKRDPLDGLAFCDRVVVPLMAGSDTSVEVWLSVCAALSVNKPVYVLAQQAGAA